ncbi:hypothetical protein ACLOJK_031210 [Asimina triloba]
MANKVTDELISSVRAVLGQEFSDMDIIRALHLANNDITAAINIIFDTPRPCARGSAVARKNSAADLGSEASVPPALACSPRRTNGKEENRSLPLESRSPSDDEVVAVEAQSKASTSTESDWWLVGSSELAGLSTCKGRRLKAGEGVTFTFPSEKLSSTSPRFPARGRSASTSSEIMRFSTKDSGEIGRIPNEWARCLLPLVRSRKIRIEGCCKDCPNVLSIMDTILLSVRYDEDLSKASKSSQQGFNCSSTSNLVQAEYTPEYLYTRKRPLDSKDSSSADLPNSPLEKCWRSSVNGSKAGNEADAISDSELDNIVGIADGSKLKEMEPPNTLQCELRPYQKQALHWMVQLERGGCFQEAARTLHPCWSAYHLSDKRELAVYLNEFSGDATTEFPSTLQMARGGILADAMGLGKTIMTISLLLACSERGGFGTSSASQGYSENCELVSICDQSLNPLNKITSISSFNKLMKFRNLLIGGGNLIICPMTLLSQWKAEIETHAQPGSLSLYVHYGQNRPKDAKLLAQYDVVLTTYGVLASEFSAENAEESGGLYSVRWFRVVLDEAHTIKSSKSQVSLAATALTADRRWCLTGTPIQHHQNGCIEMCHVSLWTPSPAVHQTGPRLGPHLGPLAWVFAWIDSSSLTPLVCWCAGPEPTRSSSPPRRLPPLLLLSGSSVLLPTHALALNRAWHRAQPDTDLGKGAEHFG